LAKTDSGDKKYIGRTSFNTCSGRTQSADWMTAQSAKICRLFPEFVRQFRQERQIFATFKSTRWTTSVHSDNLLDATNGPPGIPLAEANAPSPAWSIVSTL
jgi:hypothetical protein